MEIEFRTCYFVYIVTDKYKSLFKTGITTSLKALFPLAGMNQGAGSANGLCHLLYYEQHEEKYTAIRRETELAFLSQRKLRKFVLMSNPDLDFIAQETCSL